MNNIEKTHPELLTEWNYEKNKILPSEVSFGSGKKVWWKCELGHEWITPVKQRTRENRVSVCPYCSNKRLLSGFNDLATTTPEMEEQWDYEKNTVLPTEIFRFSNVEVFWKCKKCEGEWSKQPARRKNAACPYCSGQRVLIGFNDLQTFFPKLSTELSEKNSFGPDEITRGSNRKVWWNCELGHEWKATVSDRTSKNSGCPYCKNKKVLSGFNDLATKFPQLLKDWDYEKNEVLPSEVVFQSRKTVWWRCNECGESWSTPLLYRTGVDRSGCSVCSNKKVRAGFNDVATTHPELLKEWSPKNKIKLTEISYGTDVVILWNCLKCDHEWPANIHTRTVVKSGCPKCFNPSIGEQEVKSFIKTLTDEKVLENSRRVISPLELDIYIPSKNIAVEYNGEYWHSEEKVGKNYHYEKFKKCLDNGIRLVQVWEKDWKQSREVVEKLLTEVIRGEEDLVLSDIVMVDNETGNNVFYKNSSMYELWAVEPPRLKENGRLRVWNSGRTVWKRVDNSY